MAFPDPLSLTVDGTTTSLPRVLVSGNTGRFVSADGSYELSITPKNGVSKRRDLALRNTKITSDPLVSTTNIRVSDLIALSIIRPLNGYSDAEVVKQVVGLFGLLTASSNALLTRLVAGEN